MKYPNYLKKKRSSGVFIPNEAGSGYKEFIGELKIKSFNEISEKLGYHIDQVKHYWLSTNSENEITCVGFKVFSNDIVFIVTKGTTANLTKSQLDHFLKDYKLKEEYNSVETRSILQRGIDNKSLDYEFLSEVLKIKLPDPNGVFFSEFLNLYLYFNKGFLTDFQPSDGLNEWGKYFRAINPLIIENYENVAKKYWGDNSTNVIKEINTQSKALANVPNASKNEYIPLHLDENNTANFHMLMVCHYNKEITLDEFKRINHGRYMQQESLNASAIKYKLGNFEYEFAHDGSLLSSNLKLL